ncbi:Re/Si-specific NAD(P)(+) transhydrogenase subunit alpha [Legionella jordanis]|uniref:NAD(P) transhydrogenase subunit alpha part 1 n=1 Tax=Legionella jordanis TaxID=456 RepID=A0A0W0VFJ1_9GAMM|nr:Re/Si-specific NAD(P)(+) transhydrogenase subunit alpha [Legionella jordanis]KTD18866.1 pyridine nucleotide transhydrogenase, alpha subunit [Legionella jordanis]RMX05563.1 Re/Si-specific NAD(P)(+) transhydrogenase subunit alpha [Legionella jordanis]VEH12966.1 pyridine nucleotide transhydrogenase, alpha subunit [Legionella jordanis]
MIISTLNESDKDTRVAISPAAVKQYIKMGFEVTVETQAGNASGFSDADYQQAGATVVNERTVLLKTTNIVLLVNEPNPSELDGLQAHSLVIAHIDNEPQAELITWACKENISLISMNLIPRISRAQSMDSLSSQANLAGYRAVLEATAYFKRAIPMMMTAAGMIHPAKVLVLGAGVAGLQAIATAKRLGAVVYAFDVRRAAKEQVESLGAEFVEVGVEQDAETKGGYASETSEEYKRQQAELIDKFARQSDIVISTALIPGRKAPILLTKQTVEGMKPGSIIVDLATSRGGNCEYSERDKVVRIGGVTVVGYSNLAGFVPATASELYATNLLNLMRLLAPKAEQLNFNAEDEIIKQALLCHAGKYLPFQANKEAQHA